MNTTYIKIPLEPEDGRVGSDFTLQVQLVQLHHFVEAALAQAGDFHYWTI